MANSLQAAPVLSTPDTRILDSTEPTSTVRSSDHDVSEEELRITYDIERTLTEIRQGKWQRIALQFPDEMLSDAPRIFQLLSRGLTSQNDISISTTTTTTTSPSKVDGASCKCGKNNGLEEETVNDVANSVASNLKIREPINYQGAKLYILADTSYGTCCVDEVAAEHVNADVVVHYGRACLSPTSKLPVIHVFTHRQLDHNAVVQAFEETYPNHDEKIIIAADVTFADHVETITSILSQQKGYTDIFATSVVHNPSSPIPNRTTPISVQENPDSLRDWQLFHISDPPTALLLTLSSRVAAVRIFPTEQESTNNKSGNKTLLVSTASSLRRRYAILTSLNTVPVFGILINTLSVKNYLHIVEHVQKQISAAGKKSYMFVVGKLNAAKIANFSEIGGWVVIGCWESSLLDSKDFWKPIITPFELELALQSDSSRIWTGEWHSDYQTLLDSAKSAPPGPSHDSGELHGENVSHGNDDDDDSSSEPESAPPEFDLRTGRYISTLNTRPMQNLATPKSSSSPTGSQPASSKSLAKRFNGDVATIGGVVSPGAEFLRSQRTWNGLGSDFVIEYEDDNKDESDNRGGAIVEGRAGIARGYTVGADEERR